MRDVGKRFSVRYFLNLVLVDEEDRRYFKQQEITLWRKADSRLVRRPLAEQMFQSTQPQQPHHARLAEEVSDHVSAKQAEVEDEEEDGGVRGKFTAYAEGSDDLQEEEGGVGGNEKVASSALSASEEDEEN